MLTGDCRSRRSQSIPSHPCSAVGSASSTGRRGSVLTFSAASRSSWRSACPAGSARSLDFLRRSRRKTRRELRLKCLVLRGQEARRVSLQTGNSDVYLVHRGQARTKLGGPNCAPQEAPWPHNVMMRPRSSMRKTPLRFHGRAPKGIRAHLPFRAQGPPDRTASTWHARPALEEHWGLGQGNRCCSPPRADEARAVPAVTSC